MIIKVSQIYAYFKKQNKNIYGRYAEMSKEIKNTISHRFRAIEKLKVHLKQV